jgi:hypothetical protein
LSLLEEIIDRQKVHIEINDSIAGLVKTKIETDELEFKLPENYFYLTELVNPIQAYWERTSKIEKPLELRRKLILGNKIHNLAGVWFRNLPNFEVQEAILDGIYVGIEGVRGKIDFRIGDSIIEIKSKPFPVEDIQTIFNDYPQDLEQLLFYTALSTKLNKTNYLVFIVDEHPYNLSAFKVEIDDIKSIKTLLNTRINLLNKAIVNKNPEMLGKCRYKETGCHYLDNKICNCEQIEKINIDLLKNNIKISRDIDFESELDTVKTNYMNRFKDVLSPYQLLFPRKWYKWAINGDEDEFIRSPLREADESLLEWAIRNVPEFKIPTDFNTEIWSPSELAINIPKKFVSLHISGEGSITVPYISKVSGMYDIKKIDTPHEIALGQMAITCAFTGIPKGVIFVLYPSLGRRIYSYVINFSDLNYIKNAIIEQFDKIEDAIKNSDPSGLDRCMSFMKNGCGDGCLCK